jgi:hypothetical protein
MITLGEVFDPKVEIGKGLLVGTVAWWTRKDLTFGKDKQTGEPFKAEGVLIPLRAATEDEQRRGRSKMSGESSGAEPVRPVDTAALDDDALMAALDVIDGQDDDGLQFAVARNKSLNKDVKQAILAGNLQAQLMEAGLLEKGEDGTYKKVAVTA